ncbi:TPA: flotillin family protein, partial [Burkholderia vietnamiensis]|nr:flotillin family protein [Burkholderia vietnamiensis]
MDHLIQAGQAIAIGLAVLLVVAVLVWVSGVVRYIPDDRVGVVEKLWSRSGSVQSGLLALAGEAGFQPELLRGGFHFFAPFQYRVHIHPMVSVTQGKIGYVFARDGRDLPAGQTLADNANVDDFRDVRAFLGKGGEKGPQRKVLREGTHILNPALFVVMTEEATYSRRSIRRKR